MKICGASKHYHSMLEFVDLARPMPQIEGQEKGSTVKWHPLLQTPLVTDKAPAHGRIKHYRMSVGPKGH